MGGFFKRIGEDTKNNKGFLFVSSKSPNLKTELLTFCGA